MSFFLISFCFSVSLVPFPLFPPPPNNFKAGFLVFYGKNTRASPPPPYSGSGLY